VLGNAAAVGILLFYIIPEMGKVLFKVTGVVKTSYDSIAFLGILGINVVLLIRSTLRQRSNQ